MEAPRWPTDEQAGQTPAMRVYISVDMEGISGVTRWEDVVTRGQDYQRARSWMTADVNAAVAGAQLIARSRADIEAYDALIDAFFHS